MFDFSNLDSAAIATFWIYCIGFFVVGLIIGWIVRVGLTKIATDNFRSEKAKFESERAELMDIKEKYNLQCKDLEMNEEYWLYKRQAPEQTNDDPSLLLHNSLNEE